MGPTPFQSASATMFVLLSAMRGTQPVQKTGRGIGIMLAASPIDPCGSVEVI
jgi:hypothetical protein